MSGQKINCGAFFSFLSNCSIYISWGSTTSRTTGAVPGTEPSPTQSTAISSTMNGSTAILSQTVLKTSLGACFSFWSKVLSIPPEDPQRTEQQELFLRRNLLPHSLQPFHLWWMAILLFLWFPVLSRGNQHEAGKERGSLMHPSLPDQNCPAGF